DSYFNNAIYLGASFVSGHFSFGVRYDVLYDEGRSVYGDAWTPFIGVYF
ncbi:MAG: alpha-ketoglutarate decarboxylase, partial [Flavobacteriaceae bacterium]|nr:alpha-ketoglutarate decarboxylase [Flavobacteriaceae bacterium]